MGVGWAVAVGTTTFGVAEAGVFVVPDLEAEADAVGCGVAVGLFAPGTCPPAEDVEETLAISDAEPFAACDTISAAEAAGTTAARLSKAFGRILWSLSRFIVSLLE